MVFTDPPYNTGITKEKAKKGIWLTGFFNDSYTDEERQKFMEDFTAQAYGALKEDSVAYICLDRRRNYELIPHIKNHFTLSNTIVRDKVVHGLGSDYKYTYELINVCKKGKPTLNTHQGDKEYQDIRHIQRKIGKDEDHATKKPIELCARAIRHGSKKGDKVLDIF
jgi:DNA modification methylase